MIDFEMVVERLLLEADPIPDVPVVDKTVTDHTVEFFITPKGSSPYDKFAAKFQEKYGKQPLSSAQDIQRLITALKGSSNKNELTISNFTDYTESFPIIDFVLFVVQTSLGKTKAILGDFETAIVNDDTKNVATQASNSYINKFAANAAKDSWPLDYPSLTSQARMLEVGLRKKLADNVVGSLALEQLYGRSIYYAVLALLAGREKIRNPFRSVPSSNKFIDEILYGNYEKYAGGGEMVKGKYARMWDQVSVEKLIELGKSVRNFYEQQKAEHAPTKEAVEGAPPTPPQPVPTLEQFVKNDVGGRKFSWTVAEQLKFDDVFNNEYSQILQEGVQKTIFKDVDGVNYKVYRNDQIRPYSFVITNKQTNKEIYRLEGDNALQDTLKDVQSIDLINQSVDSIGKLLDDINLGLTELIKKYRDNPKIQKSGTEPEAPGSTLPDTGYIIKFITTLTGNDAAKDLITKLKQLGDYIAEKEPPDWAGAAKSIAKGLAGLAGASPNVGGGSLNG